MTALAELSQDLTTLTSDASARIVAIRAPNGRSQSGIVWRSGLVVTAHEALEGEDDLRVALATGEPRQATIIGRDPTTDVALLKADVGTFGDWPAATAPLPGSLVVLVGRGESSPLSTLGTIAEVGPAWRSMRGGTIDARIRLGLRLSGRAEGGAVVAPDGTLIGMAVSGPRRSVLTIPTSTIERSVVALSEKGYIPRPFLGVTLHQVSGGAGAIITGIEATSPAQTAGLRVGDVITIWDGEPIGSVRDLLRRLQAQSVGATVTVGFERGGEASELRLVVGERPRS